MTSHPIETPDLESSTDAYALRFAGPVGSYFLEIQTNTVRQLLPKGQDCSVLDVGGGHGQLVKPLVDTGYNVTVFGSNSSCRPRLDRIVGSNQYQFMEGSLLDLPCEDNAYDVVLAFRLLPHLNNWHRFIGELCRVARQCLIFDYPDLRSVNILSSLTFAMKRNVEKNTRRFRCFRRQEILAELKANNFRHDSLRGQFFFPMALHRYMKQAAVSRVFERIAYAGGLTRLFGSPVIAKACPIPNHAPA